MGCYVAELRQGSLIIVIAGAFPGEGSTTLQRDTQLLARRRFDRLTIVTTLAEIR